MIMISFFFKFHIFIQKKFFLEKIFLRLHSFFFRYKKFINFSYKIKINEYTILIKK
jgi:hypothetical protein